MANTTNISNLKYDPRNARRHTPRNVGMVEHSIQRDGFGRSILVANDGTIIAGNATVEAAASAGIENVIVVESDGKSIIAVKRTDIEPGSPEFTALAISDNRAAELAEWDAEVLQSFMDDGVDLDQFWFEDELDLLLNGEDDEPMGGNTDPDDVPDVPSDPVTKRGDLWLLGRHRLLCGDSTVVTDVDRLMDGKKADMVWTDPPYGVAIGDKNKMLDSMSRGSSNRVTRNLDNDQLDEAGLRVFLADAFSNAYVSCRPGAVWHVAAPPGPLHIVFGDELNKLGVWRQTIQWVKNNATFSPMGVDYHWKAEPIFHGWVPGAKHQYFGDRKQTTVWEIDRPTASPDHPTMKPVELVERALEHHTSGGQLILDIFLGSGTTLLAAERLQRVCYGMELDPHYCDVIVRRWEQFTGQTATLAHETPMVKQ